MSEKFAELFWFRWNVSALKPMKSELKIIRRVFKAMLEVFAGTGKKSDGLMDFEAKSGRDGAWYKHNILYCSSLFSVKWSSL